MPSKQKPAIYRGGYHKASLTLVAAAYANPWTRCACGRMLAEHARTKRTNRPPRWSAGHVIDGLIGGPLQPEVIGCNSAKANRKRNPRPRRTSRAW